VWAFGHLEPGADITVVLGVCESAMVGASSHPLQAEVGVGSALKALGVRQVVAALWQVNVLASTYLMDRMYTYLGENDMTLRQALRRAQDDTAPSPARSSTPGPSSSATSTLTTPGSPIGMTHSMSWSTTTTLRYPSQTRTTGLLGSLFERSSSQSGVC
tara:strand:+ start:342 stop:818 length:477 start_codon:yes stop_codon:yes gene_type:complete